MTLLAAGLVIFFLAHLIPTAPPAYAGLARAVGGASARKGVIALLSLVGLALIVVGKAQAPLVGVFDPPLWGRTAAFIVTPIAFVLLAAAYAPANHIRSTVRHPMMLGVAAWAGAHLAANGDAASLALFGSFAAYALIAIWSASRRDSAPAPPGGLLGDVVAIVAGLAAAAAAARFHDALFGVAIIA
ncbi:MAG: NnrU family protein [Caulobacterales bacterium]|nr:NnrU family protein [Caulobacterales bacterium]